jgi:hypothetical protein
MVLDSSRFVTIYNICTFWENIKFICTSLETDRKASFRSTNKCLFYQQDIYELQYVEHQNVKVFSKAVSKLA